MIVLAYYAGLRREELMALRISDLDWNRGLVLLRADTTKNRRERHIPISGAVEWLVQQYINGVRQDVAEAYDADAHGQLWLSESYQNPGQPLSVPAFNAIIQKIRDKVHLPLMTPHTLRHMRFTTMKRAGVSLEDIALIAGHASTETTRLYTRITPVELGKEIERRTAPYDRVIGQAVEEYMRG